MSGSGSSQQTQQASTTQLPPWVSDAAQQNYAFAQQVANRPLQQYQGQQVADVAPATQQSWNLAQTSGGAGQPQFQGAEAGLLGGLSKAAPTVTPGMLASTDLSPYMNPYINDVVNTSMAKLESQRQQSVMGNADTAVKANAFGGSRQAITDAVTNAQSALGAGQLSSQLYSQGFDTATANATADLNRQLTAAQGNQSAALTKGAQDITAAGGLESLGKDAQNNVLQQYMMLSQAGQGQQQQSQDVINANMAKFNQAWGYPTDQLNTLLSSLGMTPYGKTQTGTTDTQTQTSPDYAQAGLGLLSIGSGIFGASDRRIKKNIKRIGTHIPSGLPVHSFHFKGQLPGAPKTIGPIAQDVEKKYPAAVKEIGGIKHIAPTMLPGGGGMLMGPGAGILSPRKKTPKRLGIMSIG